MKVIPGLIIALAIMAHALADDRQALTISTFASVNDLVGNYVNYNVDQTGAINDLNDWVLRRTGDLIAYERSQISDIWERNAIGEIMYLQVYHEYKTYIEYNESDIRLVEQSIPDWQQLGALFDLEALASLKETDQYKVSDHTVSVYEGDLQGLKTTVHWVEALKLPIKVEYQRSDYQQVMELKSLYGSEDSPWKQWQREGYFGIDYVDMGDNESHPLVQALHAGGHQH